MILFAWFEFGALEHVEGSQPFQDVCLIREWGSDKLRGLRYKALFFEQLVLEAAPYGAFKQLLLFKELLDQFDLVLAERGDLVGVGQKRGAVV